MRNKSFIVHLLLLTISMQSLLALSTVDDRPVNKNSERKLSRKRRYLIFPVGSSIQMLYDQTITIPDYTLYVTTGVTVALAYGLPDKPTYPDEELREVYENGTLPLLLRRNDQNVTKHQDNAMNLTMTNHYNGSDFANWMTNYYKYYIQNRKQNSYYFGNSPLNPSNHKTYNQQYYSENRYYNKHNIIRPPYSASYDESNQFDAFAKYMYDTYFKSHASSTTTPKPTTTKATEPPEFKPIINKVHTVFPAIGKRSIGDNSLSYEDKFYLDHHRNTRHKLYEIIEKYLFAKGFNGTECVLKTLCEVGQKRSESTPGSFLAEIVRAIFSLPVSQLKRVVHKRHIDYDDAHQATTDCVSTFPLCPGSIWTAGFLVDLDATFENQNMLANSLFQNK